MMPWSVDSIFVCTGIIPFFKNEVETIKFLYFTDYALLITEKSFTEMLN